MPGCHKESHNRESYQNVDLKMSAQPTKKQNLEVIKNRLQVESLPTKFKDLSAKAIARFATHPELDSAIQVIIEQNTTIKSANGRRLVAENESESLRSKLAQFLNPSKSEIVQLWGKLFGKVRKSDDEVLNNMGALSNETYNRTLIDTKNEVDDLVRDAQHTNAQLQIAKKLMSSQQIKQLGIEYKKWCDNSN